MGLRGVGWRSVLYAVGWGCMGVGVISEFRSCVKVEVAVLGFPP